MDNPNKETIDLLLTVKRVLDENNNRSLDVQEERDIVAIAIVNELITIKEKVSCRLLSQFK